VSVGSLKHGDGTSVWFKEQYDQTCRALVLVHKTNVLEANATVPLGSCIMTAGKLEDLRAAVRGAAAALGNAGSWGDPTAVGAQISHHRLTGTSIISAYAFPVRCP
jgi:hypothetical protein